MEEQILELIKKEFEERKNKKNSTQKLIARLEKLKQNKFVKEYLELSEKLDEINYKSILDKTEDTILHYSFAKYLYQIKETNNIYVCLGTFKYSDEIDIVHGSIDHKVADNDITADYKKYCNIENEEIIQIPIRKGNLSLVEQFENNHIIIFPNIHYTQKYFYELQQEFIKEAITTNQENACKKILKRTKNNNTNVE